MTSKYIVSNEVSTTAAIGKFQNIVPAKGSIYAADGQKYNKLPVGTDGDSLTADSTTTQGLSWKPYYNPSSPTITFNLFGCFGWKQGSIFYNSFGTNPPSGNHDVPQVISFNFDTYVVAFGFKPRSSNTLGYWAPTLGSLWIGTLYFNIYGCADSANPATSLTPMTTPPVPHFSITNTEISASSSVYMVKHWTPTTPIYIPARTKFTVRTSWSAGVVNRDIPPHECYGTGNLVLTGVPN